MDVDKQLWVGRGRGDMGMLRNQEMVPQIPLTPGELQSFCFTKVGVQVWGQS